MNHKPVVSMIAAISASTRALGEGNRLLWHLPEDLKYFKETTKGHPVIMGSKTHESIGRPLPGRTNIVLSRDPNYKAEGCVVVHSLDEAFEVAKKENAEIFVIGGGQIYTAALPYAERLYLTLIDAPGTGADVFFPPYETEFKKVISETPSSSNGINFRWVVLER